MERLPLLLDGIEAGEVHIEREGLYLHFQAECDTIPEVPCRLLLRGERGTLSLGVPEPADGCLRLRKKLSLREADTAGRLLRGELQRCGERTERPEEWQRAEKPGKIPQDPALRRQMPGEALCQRRGDRVLLAFPYAPDTPFPLTRLFCLGRITRIGGRCYVVYTFDSRGEAIF